MALRASIAKNVAGDQVRLKVPHEFQAAIDQGTLGAGPYTVIAFPGTSSIVDSVVLSRELAKIASEPGTVVAVAHNFTAEAREILHQRSALRFSGNDFFWTDETLARVRNKERG